MAANHQSSPGGTESPPSIIEGRDFKSPEDHRELLERYQKLYNQGLHEGPEGKDIKAWLIERQRKLQSDSQ